MKLTTKGRYAVLALTEIALSEDKNLIKISEIAKSQNISSTYLEQILSNLKKNGFVLINEPETSFFLKFIQIVLDDESWSLKSKVFNRKSIFNPKNTIL